MKTRVVVLGAGFGGLELTTILSDAFGDAIDIVLIDKGEAFVFGFSKLDVMFGRQMPAAVRHPYRDIVKPGVRFLQSTVRSIDPAARRVVTDAGTFEAEVLVVALGADIDPAATPGLVEGGNEFYSVAGAFALRDVLPRFERGPAIIGVTGKSFKCPPAPSEAALPASRLPHQPAGAARRPRSRWSCRSARQFPRPPTRRRRFSPPSPSAVSGS